MIVQQRHKKFVEEMIKHGDQVKAYQAAWPKAKPESARVESYRILQIPTIMEMLKEQASKIEAIATQQAVTELKDEIKVEVLTVARKRELLRQIAEGEIGDKKDMYARMKAMELDSKMAGDFAPEKKSIEFEDKTPLNKLPKEELRVLEHILSKANAN